MAMAIAARAVEDRGNVRRYLGRRLKRFRFDDRRIRPVRAKKLRPIKPKTNAITTIFNIFFIKLFVRFNV